MRGFRDRDYLETAEGFYFVVIGNVHPDDRVLAYLKYVPSQSGMWASGTRKYERALKHYTMQDLAQTFKLLEMHHPEYVFHSPILGMTFSGVPHATIKRHLMPEKRLEQLLQGEESDDLEKKTVILVEELSKLASVAVESFGVTGSILMDAHKEFSDIDLVVYGRDQSLRVKEILSRLFEEESGEIRRMRGRVLEDFLHERVLFNNLSKQEAIELHRRMCNRGEAFGTCFSVHPVRPEREVFERYGDRRYTPVGLTEIEATVSDATDSMFMPAVYAVDDVEWQSGEETRNVKEIVSYEGLYADIAREGERVRVKGKLEEVTVQKTGCRYQRILIGSREAMNTDYLKPVSVPPKR